MCKINMLVGKKNNTRLIGLPYTQWFDLISKDQTI